MVPICIKYVKLYILSPIFPPISPPIWALGAHGARFWNLVSHQVTRIATRSAFLELATGAAGATGAAEVVSKTAPQTPHSTHAGGQDDGSLNKLPQIKYSLREFV